MYTSRPARLSAGYGLMPGAGCVPAPWKYSGTISTRPPMLITIAISTPIRPTFFSTDSWFMPFPQSGRLHDRSVRRAGARGDRLPDVPGHDEHAREDQGAAQQAHRVVRVGGLDRLDERVGQRAVRVRRAPHEALHHAGDPHRGDVEHHADGRDP